MKIGDIWYALRADGAALKTDIDKEGTKAAQGFGAKFKSGIKGLGGSIKGGLMQGMGLGAGLGVFGLVTGAITGFIGKLGEMRQAFMEDQVSATNMANSIKNAIPEGFEAATVAAEKFAGSQGRLGFADDEVRESLSQLVGVTHDVEEAQKLSSLAMDVARSKGITLAQATDLVSKANAGNGKALIALGVDLSNVNEIALEHAEAISQELQVAKDQMANSKDMSAADKEILKDKIKGLTAERAEVLKTGKGIGFLDALQKNVQGSAEAWAETSTGKTAVSQVRIGEAMEKMGGIIDRVAVAVIPPLTDAFAGLIDVITGVWGFLEDTGVIKAFGAAFKIVGDIVGNLVGPIKDIVGFLGDIANFVGSGIGGVVDAATGDGTGTYRGRRAGGGPIAPGQTVMVGEGGKPELVTVRGGRGWVTPLASWPSVPGGPGASMGAAFGGRGGGGDTNYITVALPATARPDPFETAQELRRMARMGVLTPSKKDAA